MAVLKRAHQLETSACTWLPSNGLDNDVANVFNAFSNACYWIVMSLRRKKIEFGPAFAQFEQDMHAIYTFSGLSGLNTYQ
jgi:hypothetical protein